MSLFCTQTTSLHTDSFMILFGLTPQTGPVELDVSTLQSETNRRVICVDLGSVYKKQAGDHFYWLEKADIAERNEWELTFTIELISGLKASATSRPFRVTTKSNYKRRSAGGWTITWSINIRRNESAKKRPPLC